MATTKGKQPDKRGQAPSQPKGASKTAGASGKGPHSKSDSKPAKTPNKTPASKPIQAPEKAIKEAKKPTLAEAIAANAEAKAMQILKTPAGPLGTVIPSAIPQLPQSVPVSSIAVVEHTPAPQPELPKDEQGRVKSGAESFPRKALNMRQQTFVAALLADPERNFSRAARKAVYRHPDAGKQLMRIPYVRFAVEKQQKKVRKVFEITAAAILQEWAGIAFFNPDDLKDSEGNPIPLKDLPEHVLRALKDFSFAYGESEVAEGEFSRVVFEKFAPYDKLRASQLIAEHLGILDIAKREWAEKTKTGGVAMQQINWDEALYGDTDRENDPIEQRLREEEALASSATALAQASNPGPKQPIPVLPRTNGQNGNGHSKKGPMK